MTTPVVTKNSRARARARRPLFSPAQLAKAACYRDQVTEFAVDAVTFIGGSAYRVPSATWAGRAYEVVVVDGQFTTCNCEDRGELCWHMAAVAMWRRGRAHASTERTT